MPKKKLIDSLIPTSKSNIHELKELLKRLRDYHNQLSSMYAIKEDIVEVTDKRHGLAKILNQHLDKFSQDSNSKLERANAELDIIHEKVTEIETFLEVKNDFQNNINEISELLNSTNADGETYQDELKELLSSSYIQKLKTQSNEIYGFWKSLKEDIDDRGSLVSQIEEACKEIQALYKDFILDDGSGESKQGELQELYKEIKEEHNLIFKSRTIISDDNETTLPSYAEQIKQQKDELNKFYLKIYGDSSSDGLESELNKRLEDLLSIEREAKKVIGLSSDAGLAGGFSQRGKQAKFNKFVSLAIFVTIMFALGVLNFYDPVTKRLSLETLNNIENFTALLVRVFFNVPFIWIAIVANVNLNKYSRLEEEYAHKESLAKSFERYKEQIKGMEDNEESKKLMTRLLYANITAFEKNAANTMDKANADTIFKQTENISSKRKDQNDDSLDDDN